MNDKLLAIQQELKAPKSARNTFANFDYRSAEAILHAVKPILHGQGCTLTITDEVLTIGEANYVKATARLSDGDKSIETSAYAREEVTKKGMDTAQITGSTSSYARKYALSGLFAIDDSSQDPDGKDNTKAVAKPTPKPAVDPHTATKKQLDRLVAITKTLELTEDNRADFFQDAIGKNRPETREDFDKAIAFGETVIDDRGLEIK